MTKPKEHALIEAIKTLPAFLELEETIPELGPVTPEAHAVYADMKAGWHEASDELHRQTMNHDAEGRPWVTGKRVGGAVLGHGEYTAEERAAILESMRQTSARFYASASLSGCHAFLEFAGLLNEFIKACADAEARGDHGWVHANGHGGNLKLELHQVAYIREKLGCIYGDAVLESELE